MKLYAHVYTENYLSQRQYKHDLFWRFTVSTWHWFWSITYTKDSSAYEFRAGHDYTDNHDHRIIGLRIGRIWFAVVEKCSDRCYGW